MERVHPKTLIATLALALLGLALVPRLRAQDVTVTPLEWAEPDPPDQLPVENHPLQPKFPEDLRNIKDPGYVLLQIFADEKGSRLMFSAQGTLPAFEEAVSLQEHGWQHKPGRRGGRAVNTYTWCAIIFNPASADASKPDATPRLLAFREVVLPSRKEKEEVPYVAPPVVWATVSLDARGAPLALKDAPPVLAPLLEKNIREWRFAPAAARANPWRPNCECRLFFAKMGKRASI